VREFVYVFGWRGKQLHSRYSRIIIVVIVDGGGQGVLVNMKYAIIGYIIAGFLELIGLILLALKKIVQSMLGLDDSQVNKPSIGSSSKVFAKYHQYKKFEVWYNKKHLFPIGFFLSITAIILGVIIFIAG